jgi:hydroxymethylbilane synthase
VPIAAHATVGDGGRLSLDGLVATLDGAEVLRDRIEGGIEEAAALGEALAARLIGRGAARLLEDSPAQVPEP